MITTDNGAIGPSSGLCRGQLQATDEANPDLELDLRRIEGRIDVLEEMLREAGQ